MLTIVAILLVLTASFAYINHRLLKWPTTIGVMAIALLVSLAIVGLDQLRRRLHDSRAGAHRQSARPWPRHEHVMDYVCQSARR